MHVLKKYQPLLADRLSFLHHYLHTELARLRYPGTPNPTPIVRVLTRLPPNPNNATNTTTQQVEGADTQGYILSCLFLDRQGTIIPLARVSSLASQQLISLRTGCVCNPGGASQLVGIAEVQEKITTAEAWEAYQETWGGEVGVVRFSLGLVSSFRDVWQVIQFAKSFQDGSF